MHRVTMFLLSAAALVAPVIASAQAAGPAAIIQTRQKHYREIGKAFKTINDELKKSAPAPSVMVGPARQIAGNLKQVGRLFPTGSGATSGVKTKALPSIWTKSAEFARLNAGAVSQADRMMLVLKGNDMAAISAQAKALGKSCHGCHQQFRDDD